MSCKICKSPGIVVDDREICWLCNKTHPENGTQRFIIRVGNAIMAELVEEFQQETDPIDQEHE
jgi:hypothetical protein